MSDSTAVFHQYRRRLQAIGYRMLGSVADAEDVVQDVWLRWHGTDRSAVVNPAAWRVVATTRASIDRLRALKAQRETYFGMWLPEPVPTHGPETPEQVHERSSDISVAMLSLLERLAPEARAAYLLREVFDVDYAQVADVLEKSEGACRQIVHRAKSQLQDERPRYVVSRDLHRHVLERFAKALAEGNFHVMRSMLNDDAEFIGDGGGHILSFPTPLVGGQRIAQLLYSSLLRYQAGVRIELGSINGEAAILRYIHGALESVQAYETDGERIVRIHVQRNPEKLARIAAARAVDLFTVRA
jgi:RNA polymerase sigma-70 factor (ECF subfamily)